MSKITVTYLAYFDNELNPRMYFHNALSAYEYYRKYAYMTCKIYKRYSNSDCLIRWL